MDLDEKGLRKAEANMQTQQGTGAALAARYDRRIGRIVVTLRSGLELAFAPRMAQGLQGAAIEDLSEIEISPSGLGLHWPRLDADLYVPSLLEGVFGSRTWMARELGARGGSVSSKAKAEAARGNGRSGGRPRKASVS